MSLAGHASKKKAFCKHFKCNQKTLDNIWKLFKIYGMDGFVENKTMHKCPANHIFLKSITENLEVDYLSWEKKLSKPLKEIIQKKYPQFMVTNKNFSLY